ncbi:unnamed protein product [Brachionus calyciflorus]|uniref:Class I SAM-dependent methyltransferase n=1 Tax=Brachionus calyciflorus TaxID=104777 RepID=A0A814LRB9_9BILA|nr:unnamed protein product [Brachionus calyciflorus]
MISFTRIYLALICIITFFSFYIYLSKRINESLISKEKKSDKRELVLDLIQNPNEFVLKYVDLPFDFGYGSNSIPLVISALISNGDFLELGIGSFSTPLLHKMSIDYYRKLISIDTNSDWVDKFKLYNDTRDHRVYLVENFENLEDKIGSKNKKWGLVLVDHIEANKRPTHAKYYAEKSEIVIVHDAEKSSEIYYQYEANSLRSSFKQACKFSIYQNKEKTSYISTLILSNYIDLTILESIFEKVKTEFGHVACNLSF